MEHPAIQQYNYHKWANDRVFEHVRSLPVGVYGKEIKSVFSSIQEVLRHIYQVDGMWLSVMSGDDFPRTMKVINQLEEESSDLTLEKMNRLYDKINQQYETFLNNCDDLDKNITIKHPHFGKLETSVTEMVKHVVNHGTYHHGNITAMLRQQGQQGIGTDYIFFLYDESQKSK